MGYTEEQKKELYFANVIIGAIKNVEMITEVMEKENEGE